MPLDLFCVFVVILRLLVVILPQFVIALVLSVAVFVAIYIYLVGLLSVCVYSSSSPSVLHHFLYLCGQFLSPL